MRQLVGVADGRDTPAKGGGLCAVARLSRRPPPLFDARLDGPCDMRPEYAQAIDWPISQAWRRALIEATGLTPKKFEP